jgi:hypothetical protein
VPADLDPAATLGGAVRPRLARRADVRHATDDDLDRLDDLLDALRRIDALTERRRGAFSLRSKALLHFHADGADLYADVRLDPNGEFERRRVTTKAERASLVRDLKRATAPTTSAS